MNPDFSYNLDFSYKWVGDGGCYKNRGSTVFQDQQIVKSMDIAWYISYIARKFRNIF